MSEDLNLDNWEVDKKTGYLVNPNKPTAITPEMKVRFLEAFKTLGDEALAAKSVGMSLPSLRQHKRSDKRFNRDYVDTLVEMKNKLEGIIFVRAQEANGFQDRKLWLVKHFPKEYDPRSVSETKKVDKDKIDQLWIEAVKKDK